MSTRFTTRTGLNKKFKNLKFYSRIAIELLFWLETTHLQKWIKSLKENDMFAWGDLVIIGLLVVLSFLPLAIFTHNQASQVETVSSASKKDQPVQIIAKISHDGEQLKQFNLTTHKGVTTWRYEDADGDYNIVEVRDHKIHVKEANCRDQIDVKMGYKSKAGETIVCLPHKFLIELSSTDGKNDDGGMVK